MVNKDIRLHATFPPQTPEQFSDLLESIATFGWNEHHPIVLCEGSTKRAELGGV